MKPTDQELQAAVDAGVQAHIIAQRRTITGLRISTARVAQAAIINGVDAAGGVRVALGWLGLTAESDYNAILAATSQEIGWHTLSGTLIDALQIPRSARWT